jgi:PAS domain S-box-containing protein
MSDPVQIERGDRDSEGFLVTDAEGVVTALGGSATELLGVERDGLVGRRLEAQFPETALTERCRQARESGHEVAFDSSEEWQLTGTAYPVDDGAAVVLRAVTDRRQSEQQLRASERALESLHDVATDPTLGTDGKIDRILEVGAERLGTPYGFLTRIEDGVQEILRSVTVGDRPEPAELSPGSTTPLSSTYCRHTLDSDGPVTFEAAGTELSEDPAYDEFGLECYLGATVRVAGAEYGTVCFVDTEPRERSFSEREQTFAELLTNWVHYLLEQQAYESELEQQQAFTESLIDSLPDPLYAFDADGELVRWNDRLAAVTGHDADALEGMSAPEFVAERDRDRLDVATARVRDGEYVSVEAAMETADGEQIPYEFSGAPLRDGSGEVSGVVGIGRDISARTEHRRRLSGLLETTQSFMQAEDPERVAEVAVNAARELLGFETGVFRLYDPEEGTLEPAAATEQAQAVLGERPVYDVEEGYPGEVFATGEPRVVRDIRDRERGPAGLASAMYYPVGVRGTLSVGSTEPDAFDEADEQLLGLLATSAAAACTRAKREGEVREAREHTERVLDRVNGLVRQTVEVLVEATTREELESGVVDELAAAAPYSFAWIGRPDVTGERLTPTTWAGGADLSAGDWSFPLDGSDPVGESYREGVPERLEREDLPDGEPWSTLADAVEALVAVPLVYKNTTYGVLVVCADDSGALDERERVVLEALGRATANAINAVERGRILDATEIIELELAITDAELLFSRLSADGGTVESAGFDQRADGSVELYLSATEVDPDAFLDRVRNDEAVESVTCIVARDDECLLEAVVAESVLVTLTEYGAALQGVHAENGTSRITVELPYEAEARDLFDLVAEQYPGTELLGYHERERPVETRQDFTASISDRLTDRQERALRTAYLGGFFDWPRGIDGNELAEAMDISRPTYHQHLRAAQAKVFEELFE